MTSFETLLTKLSIDQTQTDVHYVYYNDNMDIQKISPIKSETSENILSIKSLLVQPILDGVNRLSDYKVYFDYSLKEYSIKQKKQSPNSVITLQKIESEIDNADLNIVLDCDNITFSLNSSLFDHIKNDNSKLFFYITENNNPYKLIKNIPVVAKDLCNKVTFPHQLQSTTVSIYTSKIFDTYNLKVIQ